MSSSSTPLCSSLVPDMIGRTIDNGRIQFTAKLGEGAYGVVYCAVDVESPSSSSNPKPREYAIKILAKAPPNTRRWHFQRREVAAHKAVSEHPNILTLHQVIENDRFIYLIMDYCPGGDLFSAIIERHMYCGNDHLVKKVFVQILDAVQACHDKGIYHRDLKPDNVFCLNKDASEIVLGDFGLSTSSATSTTFGCGSSYYISPECLGREFGFRRYSPKTADVWALGVILTNMIVGRNPWHQATTDDQCFLRFMADTQYLRKMLPVSEAANSVLRRIFTFDPSNRITIPELREEILKVDTFFMTQDEIDNGGRLLKIAAETYAADRCRSLSSGDIQALREEQAIFNRTENMVEGVVVEDPADHFRIVDAVGTTPSEFINGMDSDSDSGSDSEDDSDVPITPESHAQDSRVLIEVPDMLEGEDMGNAVLPINEKKLAEGFPMESLVQRLARFAL